MRRLPVIPLPYLPCFRKRDDSKSNKEPEKVITVSSAEEKSSKKAEADTSKKVATQVPKEYKPQVASEVIKDEKIVEGVKKHIEEAETLRKESEQKKEYVPSGLEYRVAREVLGNIGLLEEIKNKIEYSIKSEREIVQPYGIPKQGLQDFISQYIPMLREGLATSNTKDIVEILKGTYSRTEELLKSIEDERVKRMYAGICAVIDVVKKLHSKIKDKVIELAEAIDKKYKGGGRFAEYVKGGGIEKEYNYIERIVTDYVKSKKGKLPIEEIKEFLYKQFEFKEEVLQAFLEIGEYLLKVR